MRNTIKIFFLLNFVVCTQSEAQWFKNMFKPNEKVAKINFTKNEDGKIAYYEVVTQDTIPRDSLFKNAQFWMNTILNEKGDKIILNDYLTGTIEADISYIAYNSGMVNKNIQGKMSYKVTIQVKDKKYRYLFTDFVFQPYKQFRQTNTYLPEPKKFRPLEKEKVPGWQKSWNIQRYNLDQKVKNQIAQLKVEIVAKKKQKMESTTIPSIIHIKTTDW